MTGKWDVRFLRLAKEVSSWSKDPSTRTGAVITDVDNRIVSLGYNGFPRGVQDLPERYAERELKYRMIVHCEANAILFAQRSLKGCCLYTWPFMSCAACAGLVIQSGITKVIAPQSDAERWLKEFTISGTMFREAGIEVFLVDETEGY